MCAVSFMKQIRNNDMKWTVQISSRGRSWQIIVHPATFQTFYTMLMKYFVKRATQRHIFRECVHLPADISSFCPLKMCLLLHQTKNVLVVFVCFQDLEPSLPHFLSSNNNKLQWKCRGEKQVKKQIHFIYIFISCVCFLMTIVCLGTCGSNSRSLVLWRLVSPT